MRHYSGQYIIHEATHSLVVLDEAGNELASVPVQQQDTGHADNATIEFDVLLPVFPQADVYQLRSTDHEFARLDVSPNAPTVTWEPITQTQEGTRTKVLFAWYVEDLDADQLTYTLLYTPDGEHWQVLTAGLTEPSYEVFLDTLPGGDTPVFQVIAFDGTRAASALSAPIPPPPGMQPTLLADGTVLSGATVPSGADVWLQATAFDPEDRTLSGDAISWSSSLDGELGTGSELVVDDLSAGSHVITATVTDSDGLTDTSSFELEIDGSIVQPQPDPELVSAVDAVFAAVASGADPAAALNEATAPPADALPLVLVVVGVVAAAAVGGTLLWRSRRPNR